MTPYEKMVEDTWTELADALRDATGPSRELDARLMCAATGYEFVKSDTSTLCEAQWPKPPFHAFILRRGDIGTWENSIPHFTDTLHIGQIIKVIGERLPEYSWVVGHNDNVDEGLYLGALISSEDEFKCPATQPALALCEAFCRAMGDTYSST